MTPARVVAVHFKGLLGHQSDKKTKAVTIFVTQITITSQLLAWKWSYHWQLITIVISELAPLNGVNEIKATLTKFWYFLGVFSWKFTTSTPVIFIGECPPGAPLHIRHNVFWRVPSYLYWQCSFVWLEMIFSALWTPQYFLLKFPDPPPSFSWYSISSFIHCDSFATCLYDPNVSLQNL